MYMLTLIRYSRACGSYHVIPIEVAADKEATELMLPSGEVEVTTLKVLQSSPLHNICVSNDHGYVPMS